MIPPAGRKHVILCVAAGAAVGYAIHLPLLIVMSDSFRALIHVEHWYKHQTDYWWTQVIFISLAAVTGGLIPAASLIRWLPGGADDCMCFMRDSALVAARAFLSFLVLTFCIYRIIQASWSYHHDGVFDALFLLIPAGTGAVVVIHALVKCSRKVVGS